MKIKGIAVKRDTVSKNRRLYTEPTLSKGASSFIDEPITENHRNWKDKKNHLGRINWMAYEDGGMEYVAEVWNPSMVAELRLYAKDPTLSRVKGVSIEADYLFDECPDCKKRFTDPALFESHMVDKHAKPMKGVPAYIKGRALSIVTAPEEPGVPNNTLEVMEFAGHDFSQLLNRVTEIKEMEEKIKMNTNKNYGIENKGAVVAPSAKELSKEEMQKLTVTASPQPVIEAEQPIQPAVNLDASVLVVRESAKLSKLEYKIIEGKYPTFEACMADLNDEDQCAALCKETRQTNETNKKIIEVVNQIVEVLNQPFTVSVSKEKPFDDSKIQETIVGMQKADNQINNAQLEHYKELKEAVDAIQKDDLGWKDIKPFDDTALKESIATIKPYDDAPIKTMLETTNKTLTEKIDQTASKTSLIEITAKLTTLEAENKTLTETLASQKHDFEATLSIADKNTGLLRKEIEETKKQLAEQKQIAESKAKELKEIKESTDTKIEDLADKLKPTFKANTKLAPKNTESPVIDNPMENSRRVY